MECVQYGYSGEEPFITLKEFIRIGARLNNKAILKLNVSLAICLFGILLAPRARSNAKGLLYSCEPVALTSSAREVITKR
jgi:hypothetical protein